MFSDCSHAPSETDAAKLSRLSMFDGWQLSANCPRCRLIRRVMISDLIAQLGKETIIGDIVARLRCQTCGTHPDWVCLADGVEGMGRKVQRITLVEQPRSAATGPHAAA